jgi:hypothetical protein
MVSGGPWSRAICPSRYELTKLDDDTFDQKLRDGTIRPDMQRKDAGRRPVENLASIRRTGSRGEQVSAISARSARDPEDPNMSEETEERSTVSVWWSTHWRLRS